MGSPRPNIHYLPELPDEMIDSGCLSVLSGMMEEFAKSSKQLLEFYAEKGMLFYSFQYYTNKNRLGEFNDPRIEPDQGGLYHLTDNLIRAVVEAVIPEKVKTKFGYNIDLRKKGTFLTLPKEALGDIETEGKSMVGVIYALYPTIFEKVSEDRYRLKGTEFQVIGKGTVMYKDFLGYWVKDKAEEDNRLIFRLE